MHPRSVWVGMGVCEVGGNHHLMREEGPSSAKAP